MSISRQPVARHFAELTSGERWSMPVSSQCDRHNPTGEEKMTSAIKTFAGMAILVAAVATGSGAAHAQSAATSDFVPKKAGQFVLALRITDVAPSAKGDILTA